MDAELGALFEAAIEQAFNAVVITDADMAGGPYITYANPAFCRMTGYPLEELLGRSPRILQGPATSSAVIAELRACLREGRFFEGETVNYRKDGQPYHVRWNISPVRAGDGAITHFVSVQLDTTDRVRTLQERDLMARALDSASEVIAIFDRDGRFVHLNAAAERSLGRPADALVGQPFHVLRAEPLANDETWEDLTSAGASGRSVLELRRGDGGRMFFERSVSPIVDGDGHVTHYVSVGSDVSERVREQRRLRELAEHDALTGLLQRATGDEALRRLVEAAHRDATPLALLACDIDHFKAVNDQHGHLIGDRVLQLVAKALATNVRSDDVVTRFGGEEFVVILPGCGRADATAKAEQLRQAVAAQHDPEAGPVTISVGIALLRSGDTPESLLDRADTALYRAKRGGRDRYELSPD